MKKYGINMIGYGKRKRYALVEIISVRGLNPVEGRSYSTLCEAEAAAAARGIGISAVGDIWELT